MEEDDKAQIPLDIHALNSKPILGFSEVAVLLDVPLSTLMQVMDTVPMEGAFTIGRRRKVTRRDLDVWIEQLKETFPWTERVNNTSRRKRGR